MTFSSDKDSGILDEFDEWFESVESNINSNFSEEDIESTNQQVQEFLDELQEKIDNSESE